MLTRSSLLKRRYTISVLDKLLKRDGKGSKFYDLAYSTEPREHSVSLPSANELNALQSGVEVSTLENGIRVLTQPSCTPGQLGLGLLLELGSRDETPETSGSLHSIKTTKYKSSLQTNETVNYGMVQMSGGSYHMNYDRETAYFSARCLDHDAVDIFSMMADCALEPRNLLAANVAMQKLPFSHQLARANNSHHDLDDLVMRNIFGDSGLGNSLLGESSNIANLNAFTLQKFQINNISSNKIIVSGLGVNSHNEFRELVESRLGDLNYSSTVQATRESSSFHENRIVIPERSNLTTAVMSLEGPAWHNSEVLTAQLLETVLGGVEVGHFESLVQPEGELYKSYYKDRAYVNSVEAFSQHFSDSGVFGLRVNCLSQEAPQAVRDLASSVKSILANLTDAQLLSAKNRLAIRIMRALDNPATRLEEYSRNLSSVNKIVAHNWVTQLDSIVLDSFKNNANQILKGKLNFTAKGGNVDLMPELAEIKELLT